MLTITPAASEAVRQILAQAPVDDDTGGLRIGPGEPTDIGTSLEMTLVDRPEEADQDVGAGDAHVYVDSRTAGALDDKVLDARVEDGSIGFALRDPEPEQQ